MTDNGPDLTEEEFGAYLRTPAVEEALRPLMEEMWARMGARRGGAPKEPAADPVQRHLEDAADAAGLHLLDITELMKEYTARTLQIVLAYRERERVKAQLRVEPGDGV